MDVEAALTAAAVGDVVVDMNAEADAPPAYDLALAEAASATARLAAGLPADLPAAFAATETLRTLVAAGENEWAGERGDGGHGNRGQDAVAANLLLVWLAIGDAATRDAALKELDALDGWAEKHGGGAEDLREQRRALRIDAIALTAGWLPTPPPPPTAAFGPWRSAAVGADGAASAVRSPWAIVNGQAQATGDGRTNLLVFRYPLAGTFSARVVARDAGGVEGHVLYGGLIHESFGYDRSHRVRDVRGARSPKTPAAWLAQGDDQRVRVDVSPVSAVVRIQGRRVWGDDRPPAASPFLGLACTDGRRSWFRSVQIEGEPTIPPEVDLIAGDRLDGWFAAGGNGPATRDELVSDRDRARAARRAVRQGAGAGDAWEADGGVLRSRSDRNPGALTHHRPLFDGDRVSFRFRTVGTVPTVAPALDRVAFVLDPAGVRLRWLPVRLVNATNDDFGLARAHAVPAPGALGPVPLKPDDWNAAELAVADGVLTLSVNGVAVLERALDDGVGTAPGPSHPDRLFALAPTPGRDAVVRDVILTGDWPDRLPDAWAANLLLAPALTDAGEDPAPADTLAAVAGALDPASDPAARAAGLRSAAWVEHGQATEASWEFVSAAAALPPGPRLRVLLDHLLPTTADPHWRCELAASPADPPPGVSVYAVETPTAGRRVPTGGNLVSPTLLLAETAAELGVAAEVAAVIEPVPAGGGFDPPAKAAALLALAYAAGTDPAPHAAVLDASAATLEANPVWEGRPVLVAARAAADFALGTAGSDADRAAAADLARRLAGRRLDPLRVHLGPPYELQKGHAHAVLGELAARLGGSTGPDPAAWVAAPEPTLPRRSVGLPPAVWAAGAADDGAGGRIDHLTGGDRDRLFAVRPAAGPVTVAATQSYGPGEYATLLAGGLGVQGSPESGGYRVRSLARQCRTAERSPADVPAAGTSAVTYAVPGGDDGRFAATVDGGLLFETRLGAGAWDPPLPFLAAEARGTQRGSVADLRATGDPVTPETVDLLPAEPGRVPDWWADAHGDPDGDRTTAFWTWDDAAKALSAARDAAEADRETLLVFPRPLAAATETLRFEFRTPAAENAPATVVAEPAEVFEEATIDFDPTAGFSLPVAPQVTSLPSPYFLRDDVQYFPADAASISAPTPPVATTAPDRAGVHVAFGRVAFVLAPDGVSLHRITAGSASRVWLAADAVEAVPEHRRGPGTLDLAPDAWHAVELTVAGDTATLALDGAVVYEHPVAPANRRVPGLFRWSGDRPVQVRNVTLTGSWADNPAAVPAAE